jgi:hypothetical protein
MKSPSPVLPKYLTMFWGSTIGASITGDGIIWTIGVFWTRGVFWTIGI